MRYVIWKKGVLFNEECSDFRIFVCYILLMKSSQVSMVVVYDSINQEFLYSMVAYDLEVCLRT